MNIKAEIINSKYALICEQVVFTALLVYISLIIFSIPTDLNGDPNDYLYSARNLFSLETLSNFNRFIGYPIFIKISSLNLAQLNLTFVVQSIIFLVALYYFARSISSNPLIRVLIYLPAFIPAVAYLPKLLFPDCLLISFLLLFCASLLRKHFFWGALFACILIFIKLVFVFCIPFWLAYFLIIQKPNYSQLIKLLYLGFLVALIPIVFFLTPFPLYQTTVQNPAFVLDREQANPLPVNSATQILCGNNTFVLLDSVSPKDIVEHSSDALYMPIGKDEAKKRGCSLSDIKTIQRQLVSRSIFLDPSFHTFKYTKRFLRDVFVFPDAQHLWWMLDTKLHLQVSKDIDESFYSPSELDYFQSQEIKPLKQPNLRLLSSLVSLNPMMLKVFSYCILGSFFFGIILYLRIKEAPTGVFLILGLLVSYNFVITFFAFGYDRYLMVNYFLWLGIIGLYLDHLHQYLLIKQSYE
jgi:hypothetical protein